MADKENKNGKKNNDATIITADLIEQLPIHRHIPGKCIHFFGEKDSYKIPLNPENTYFKVTKIEVCPKLKENKEIWYGNSINITCKINAIGVSSRTEIIDALDNQSFQNNNKTIEINEVINNGEPADNIEFDYTCEEKFNCDVYVYYTTIDKRVDIKNPYENFSNHIKLKDNVKILFSGPFGQGKTTFLGDFFERNEAKYEVFKLYPVNYAVSHNEDIFKYIKAEIIFQLMGKDVEFDKLDFNYLESTYSYFSENIDKIVSPLLSLLPKIGETAAKVFDKIYELSKAVKEHKTKLNIDDKGDALKYIHDLYEKEGSIFEDNFYTQLIRQLLEQHKQKHEKENVLIIDDIDRMDPDHIFRIFNVFSANFDSSEYRIGLSNKFGFDKIILVCDYSNIKKLFVHRYGNSYSFDGYLSKYYSRNPYQYDNAKAIEVITTQLTNHENRPVNSVITNILVLIINDLVHSNEIVLRDLLKLLNYNFYKTIDSQSNLYSDSLKKHKHELLYFNIIAFLEHLFDKETISEKIKRCKHKAPYRNSINYNYYTQIGLVPLATTNTISNTNFVLFNNNGFTFKTNQTNDRPLNYNYYEALEVKTETGESYKFGMKDFYDMFILNIEKYIER